MAEDDRPEIERALMNFRTALIEALTDIQVQLATVEAACLERESLTEERLRQLRAVATERRERFRERLAQRLPSPYELR